MVPKDTRLQSPEVVLFFDKTETVLHGAAQLWRWLHHLPLLVLGVGFAEHVPAPVPLHHVAVTASLSEHGLGLEAQRCRQLRREAVWWQQGTRARGPR